LVQFYIRLNMEKKRRNYKFWNFDFKKGINYYKTYSGRSWTSEVGGSLRVTTYNVKNFEKVHTLDAKTALEQKSKLEIRYDLIASELRFINSDLVALQEVSAKIEKLLSFSEKYMSIFELHASSYHGCALLWDYTKWKFIKKFSLSDYEDFCLFSILESVKNPSTRILFGSVYFKSQTKLTSCSFLKNFVNSFSGQVQNVVLAGNFQLSPESYNYLQGKVDHLTVHLPLEIVDLVPVKQSESKYASREHQVFVEETRDHDRLQLKSAYFCLPSNLQFTCFENPKQQIQDYIWYYGDLEVSRVLKPPFVESSSAFPSSHISLTAEFNIV